MADSWKHIGETVGDAILNIADAGYPNWTVLKLEIDVPDIAAQIDETAPPEFFRKLTCFLYREDVESYINSNKVSEQKYGRYCWNSHYKYEELYITFTSLITVNLVQYIYQETNYTQYVTINYFVLDPGEPSDEGEADGGDVDGQSS